MRAHGGTAADPARRTDVLRASPPLSRSGVVERLVHVHPLTPPALFGPAIATLLILSLGRMEPVAVLAWGAGGYALWTLVEYWTHRVVLHFEPERGLGARLHWIFHGAHHDHPNNPKLLLVPPVVSVPLAALYCLVFWLVLGSPEWLGFAAGYLTGYLVYDMTHWRLHHRVPRTRLGRRLREHHMRHHFQDETRGFGVTAPYWDRVFGTSPRRRRMRAAG